MRSAGGTNFGLSLSVVAFTKATMASLAGPAFQEGRGSPEFWEVAQPAQSARSAATKAMLLIVRMMSGFVFIIGALGLAAQQTCLVRWRIRGPRRKPARVFHHRIP